jgi:hypothetical protein
MRSAEVVTAGGRGSSIICVCVWVEGWCRVIGLTVFSRKYLILHFWK